MHERRVQKCFLSFSRWRRHSCSMTSAGVFCSPVCLHLHPNQFWARSECLASPLLLILFKWISSVCGILKLIEGSVLCGIHQGIHRITKRLSWLHVYLSWSPWKAKKKKKLLCLCTSSQERKPEDIIVSSEPHFLIHKALLLSVWLDTDHTQHGLGLIQGFQHQTLHLERIYVRYVLFQFIQMIRKIGSDYTSRLEAQTPHHLKTLELTYCYVV